MKIAIACVSYNQNKNFDWTKLWSGQLRKFLPEIAMVLVDHNDIMEEHKLCKKHNIYITQNRNQIKSHGTGFDAAANWCRTNGYDVMIHIEPDVVIYGINWFRKMVESIENGAWVVGIFDRAYCPEIMHGSISAWSLPHCKNSFDIQPKLHDLYDDFYRRLVDERRIFQVWGEHSLPHVKFFLYNWDVGDKNWYEAHKAGRYKKIISDDCIHIWRSSFKSPQEIWLSEKDIHQNQSVQTTKIDDRFQNLIMEYLKPIKMI